LIAELKGLAMEPMRKFKELVNLSLFSGLATHLDKERLYVAELGGRPEFNKRLDAVLKR